MWITLPEKDAYYFSHDSNARNDIKISAMLSVYKAEGYGYYWITVENLREQSDFKLPFNDYTFDMLAKQMQCRRIKVKKFIEDCLKEFKDLQGHGLFESDGYCFWSNSLNRRMKKLEEKRLTAKKNAEDGWEKRRKKDADA